MPGPGLENGRSKTALGLEKSQTRRRISSEVAPNEMHKYKARMFEAAPALMRILITKALGARSAILGDGSREPSARAPPRVRARPRRDSAAASELPESPCKAT